MADAAPSPWLAQIVRSEAFPGMLLVGAAAAALLLANSPRADDWRLLWETPLTLQLGGATLSKSALHWINDGLMVLFFFFVGLELKHEVLDGHLRSPRQALLPLAAAAGGMLFPALLYAAITAGSADPAARDGWAIPMATDIAFALGVLALLGSRVPPGLKVFLAALAVADDLGAVVVIALFYTEAIAWPFLGGGVAIVALSYLLNRAGVRHTWPYVLLGIAIWLLFLRSGIHATIAGVALAVTVPARRRLDEAEFSRRARQLLDEFDHVADPTPRTNDEQLARVHALARHCTDVQAPLQRMEHGLAPLVAHAVVPLFALANAGVDVGAGIDVALRHPAAWGTFAGLLLGKPLGILSAVWVCTRWLGRDLPLGCSWQHVHGAAWLAGIGFTMALFVNGLAFASGSAAFAAAKIAILAASAAAAGMGVFVLRRAPRS
jgi:NhaA family Na+:H+ antiporter